MSGNINFSVYPVSNRVPGVYAEVNNSAANTGAINQRTLIIGQMTSAGNAAPGIAQILSGQGQAAAAFGANSMLALMAAQYRLSDIFGEVWCLPLEDAAGATAATGTIAFSGSPTANGSLALYIAGTLVLTALSAGQTAASIASAVLASINATPNLPVTAAVTTNTITLTAVNKGACGNEIDMRLNYRGNGGGEATPPGLTVAFTGTSSGSGTLLSGGAGSPLLTPALANLPTQPFDFIANPYSDTASIAALDLFLNDTSGRWSWEQELFGGYFGAYRGTLAASSTFGVGNNGQHGSCMAMYDAPQPAWIWAAEITAQCAVSLRANPAQPMQTVQLNLLAPPLQSQWDISERNTLLYDGLSTFKVNQGGQVLIERMVTMYQLNAAGQPDNSYLDVNTLYELMAVIRAYRTYLASQFPRSILVADGTKITFGSNMITAAVILASVNAYYQTLADQGFVQNPAQFAQQSRAQNAGNGLVKLFLPVQLANQLRVIAMLVEFSKP